MPANPEVPKARHAEGELSDVDLLRVRLWRARASHSRQAGLSLVMLSAALFAGAFYTSALILEVGSVSSFVIGVGLLAYEAEPRAGTSFRLCCNLSAGFTVTAGPASDSNSPAP